MNVSRYLKIGLFFISLGTAGTIYVVRSTDGFNDLNTKTYEVVMDDATGLAVNSKVYLAGVPVGKIRGINLTEGQALLQVAFLRDVELRSDAQISRKSSSLLGTSILTLTPGTELTPIVREGGRIQSQAAAADMTALVSSAEMLGDQFSELLKEFQANQMQLLAVSLETFNSIARKLDERSDEELDRVSRILESSALITEQFEKMLREREGDLSASTGEVRAALENIRAVTEEIRGGKGNVGSLVYDDRLYASLLSSAQRTEEAALKLNLALENVNNLAVNADRVVSDAGVIVDKAAGLGVQVDAQSRYALLSASFRGGASLRLEPRSRDRWYRVGVNSAPDGQDPLLDVELARRWGPLTFRGGLLENTAGLGLDLQPLGWLGISGEIFDFNAESLPNLRGTVTLYPFFDPASDKPWNWLYLQGGVDAALDARRDYFFGAGLRFADEEVRGLVGLVPLAGN